METNESWEWEWENELTCEEVGKTPTLERRRKNRHNKWTDHYCVSCNPAPHRVVKLHAGRIGIVDEPKCSACKVLEMLNRSGGA